MSGVEGKSLRELEKIVKGFSNHRRIEIIKLLSANPELSLADISHKLKINFKTASEHVLRLSRAGLVSKRYGGRCVYHKNTDLAGDVLTFLRMLERK